TGRASNSQKADGARPWRAKIRSAQRPARGRRPSSPERPVCGGDGRETGDCRTNNDGGTMRRDRYVMQGFALAAALVFPAATALAGPPGGQGEVVAKYYENLGGTDLFQIDANGNLQWDGKA